MSSEAKLDKLHRCLDFAEFVRTLKLRSLKYSCEIQTDFNVKKKSETAVHNFPPNQNKVRNSPSAEYVKLPDRENIATGTRF